MEVTNPRVLKERQQRYQKLIRMIKGFQRTTQELKLLQKIKYDTVFEISMRFRRCDANKTYRFPKTPEADEPDSDDEDNFVLVSNKELIYNLHSQNRQKTELNQQRQTIKTLQIEDSIVKRQKTDVTTTSSTRAFSLNNEKPRESRQRIDRIEKLHHWAAERQRTKTEKANQRKFNASTTRIPFVLSKEAIKSEALSKNSSNHISHVKTMAIASRRHVSKTELSPAKIDKSIQKLKLLTEQIEIPHQKTQQKKLYTEESEIQTAKKGRIQNFLTNQLKKIQKTTLVTSMGDTHLLKPKNLFYKQAY